MRTEQEIRDRINLIKSRLIKQRSGNSMIPIEWTLRSLEELEWVLNEKQ